MTDHNRRDFLRGAAAAAGTGLALSVFPPAIRKALAITAKRRTGTIQDVEHVVVLMQENRSFDHYFGTLRGVRGFGDRFPIPVPNSAGIANKTVWYQTTGGTEPAVIAPFPLNTAKNFEHMRVSGTPHTWPNATFAWDHGKLSQWPVEKQNHSLGYYTQEDIPFQFALAEAFTLCDAYHCSFQGGTNPNRMFLWTGTNDPLQQGNGPVITNAYDNLEYDPEGGYTFLTYSERLEKAGIRWQVYQNMADNFTDNPLAGFRSYRDAVSGRSGAVEALKTRGLSTRDLDLLREDVLARNLPQVSWIVATAEGSEHPGPSSPAQGADYTARVLDALTADPEVWSRTVLFINFDENDGFFDHVPPPSAPSYEVWDADEAQHVLAGASTVSTLGEYHEIVAPDADENARALQHRPYGLGPRVPMYVVSPWSKGGWVNSEVFDHTSVIRFMEKRFGVLEPNISPWRRAVCGDLTSAFDFADVEGGPFSEELPDTSELAERARALPSTTTPPTPTQLVLPAQELGVRPARPLGYELHVSSRVEPQNGRVRLLFANRGRIAAVFHVYDRLNLSAVPRRYTVEAGRHLWGEWQARTAGGDYDLWVLGPNGFHRHFTGELSALDRRGAPHPEVQVSYQAITGDLTARLLNHGRSACTFLLRANAYFRHAEWKVRVAPQGRVEHDWSLRRSAHWYDFTVSVAELAGFSRRFAGHVETGRPSFSDPAMGGMAVGEQIERSPTVP